MDEKVIYGLSTWACAAMSIIAGLGTVFLLVATISEGLRLLPPTLLLAIVTVGFGWGTTYFGQRLKGHEKVFSNPVEQEVLTVKQRRELRMKRGELVMQRSLIEIENERDNIIHRQIEAANDPDKPPHVTRFGVEDGPQVIRARACTCGPIWSNETLAKVSGPHHAKGCPMYPTN
jgi:hypothetical protein